MFDNNTRNYLIVKENRSVTILSSTCTTNIFSYYIIL